MIVEHYKRHAVQLLVGVDVGLPELSESGLRIAQSPASESSSNGFIELTIGLITRKFQGWCFKAERPKRSGYFTIPSNRTR